MTICFRGKVLYMAPEIYRGDNEPYDCFKADLWSAGVIFFIMLIGCRPFDMPDPSDECYKWISNNNLPKLLRSWDICMPSDDAICLMERMLCSDQDKRITVQEALDHSWFNFTP